MDSVISRLIINNWQRKLVAILVAIAIWFIVSESIMTTKTIHSVPVRVINLPANKTIEGLLPNGFLSQRITLTLTGSKEVIDQLEPGDLEILLDAAGQSNDWIVHISGKNLLSLNPKIDLTRHIKQISHPEFALKIVSLNLETAVQNDKVMQGFELGSLLMGGNHSQKAKTATIRSDYGSKDCVNLSSSTAVSSLNPQRIKEKGTPK
jgi:hypothetical protein